MCIHLHKGARALEVCARVCVCVYACTIVHASVCLCVCVHPLYPSVMNSQLMKEPLLLPFHQPGNNYLVSEAILHLYHTQQLHLAAISLKNPILSLPLFLSLPPLSLLFPFCYTSTPPPIWSQIKPPHWAPPSPTCFKYDELINSIKWQMIVRRIWLLMV